VEAGGVWFILKIQLQLYSVHLGLSPGILYKPVMSIWSNLKMWRFDELSLNDTQKDNPGLWEKNPSTVAFSGLALNSSWFCIFKAAHSVPVPQECKSR
jgi:hypothetical protein